MQPVMPGSDQEFVTFISSRPRSGVLTDRVPTGPAQVASCFLLAPAGTLRPFSPLSAVCSHRPQHSARPGRPGPACELHGHQPHTSRPGCWHQDGAPAPELLSQPPRRPPRAGLLPPGRARYLTSNPCLVPERDSDEDATALASGPRAASMRPLGPSPGTCQRPGPVQQGAHQMNTTGSLCGLCHFHCRAVFGRKQRCPCSDNRQTWYECRNLLCVFYLSYKKDPEVPALCAVDNCKSIRRLFPQKCHCS